MELGIEGGEVAFGMLDLARDPKECGAVLGEGGVDLAMIVQEALQGFGIAAAVGLVGANHEQGIVLLLGGVDCEVGVDALGDLPKERFEAERWIELLDFLGLTPGAVVGFLRALAGLLRPAAGGVGVVEVDFALSDSRFEIVELRVEDTDLAEVAGFKGFELGAPVAECGCALGEGAANSGKLLTPREESGGVRVLLEDDFVWHAEFVYAATSLVAWVAGLARFLTSTGRYAMLKLVLGWRKG